MKYWLLAASLLLTTMTAQAQMPGGFGAGQGQNKGGGMPKMGKMYGKIVEAATGKPVEAASVVFLQQQKGTDGQPKEVMVKSVLTEANGEFSLDELPMMGSFRLAVNAIGYKPLKMPVGFDMSALMKAGAEARKGGDGSFAVPDNAGALLAAVNKDLGNLRLEADQSTQLKGVTVTGSAPQFQLQGEKKIFNVDKNLTSQGGTAQDVMKNVPGVLVDADGKVTVRNTAPQLLVDGRPTPLQLDQIPADAIESVELITNPSAKYDAEGGTGGVLNIVLKKNKRTGYNGNVRAGVDSRGGFNGGGDFNFRSGKFNVSSNLMGMRNVSKTTGYTDRNDLYEDPQRYTRQDNENKTKGGFGFARLGVDYFLSNRTTLSLTGMKVYGQFKPGEEIDIRTDSLFPSGTVQAWSRRNSNTKSEFNMNGGQFGIKHNFQQPGREWTFDASFHGGRNENESNYTSTFYGDAAYSSILREARQRTSGKGSNNFVVLQSDYVHPLKNNSKIEGGIKATIRKVENDISNYLFDSTANDYVLLPYNGSNYKNTDQVYAAYGSYSGNIDANTSFQLGLRAESYRYDGELSTTGQTFTNNYPVSLFPSVFVSRKLKKDQQLQFSYRRGINRPNFFQLLPYTDYSDQLNIRQGNSGLKPEFTNTAELNYMKNFSRTNYVLASVYYKRSDDLITQYQTTGINPFTGQTAIINSYINASSSDKFGLELTTQWALTKWWDLLVNANVYNSTINTDVEGMSNSDNSYTSGFGKINNTFKLPKKFTVQLSGVFQSRTNLPPDNKDGFRPGGGPMMQASSAAQGYLDANWSTDIAIKKTFLKNDAASLSLSVNDIFATRKFLQHSESDYFVQDYSRLTNPRMVRLNFSWRFGKFDTDIFRRKNLKGMTEGMKDATDGMGGY